MRRLLAAGVSLGAAVAYAHALDPATAEASHQPGCDHYASPAPGATTEPATNVQEKSATLNGNAYPNCQSSVAYFEYGRTTAYGSTTKPRPIGSGSTNQAVSEVVEGLEAGATYNYRLIVTNGSATVQGADQAFATPDNTPPRPRVEGLATTLGALIRTRRMHVRVSVDEPGTADLVATMPRPRARGSAGSAAKSLTLGRTRLTFDQPSIFTARIKVNRAALRALRRQTSARITVTATVRDRAGHKTIRRTTLRAFP